MSKIVRPSIPVDIITIKYKLTKVGDDFGAKFGEKIAWIEWNDNGTFKQKHDEPAIGRSLILDPHHLSYTWLTTTVTEIIEQTDSFIIFKTENSHYKLEKIGSESLDI